MASQLKTNMDSISSLHPLAKAWLLDGPLATHLDAYTALLERGNYAASTMQTSFRALAHFAHWMSRCRVTAAQLNQVFLNLLVNAANAIETRGDITITTQSPTPGTIRISISDTGCGIPSLNQGRIFDPFFTTKSVGQGTGLGLSIVYCIVRKHYGNIEVESTVGQGSTFVLTLPVDPPA